MNQRRRDTAEWFKGSLDLKGTHRSSRSTSFPPSLSSFLGLVLEYSCDRELTTSHTNPSVSKVLISSITKT